MERRHKGKQLWEKQPDGSFKHLQERVRVVPDGLKYRIEYKSPDNHRRERYRIYKNAVGHSAWSLTMALRMGGQLARDMRQARKALEVSAA